MVKHHVGIGGNIIRKIPADGKNFVFGSMTLGESFAVSVEWRAVAGKSVRRKGKGGKRGRRGKGVPSQSRLYRSAIRVRLFIFP